MNVSSARPQYLSVEPVPSSANSRERLSVYSLTNTPEMGSLDDSELIRNHLVRAIKSSGKSRTQIAEEMSFYTGKHITDKMLDAFTAPTRADRRWPSEYNRAFCHATGDYELLRCQIERCGFRVIGRQEIALMEIGRRYLQQKRHAAELADLEHSLEGSSL